MTQDRHGHPSHGSNLSAWRRDHHRRRLCPLRERQDHQSVGDQHEMKSETTINSPRLFSAPSSDASITLKIGNKNHFATDSTCQASAGDSNTFGARCQVLSDVLVSDFCIIGMYSAIDVSEMYQAHTRLARSTDYAATQDDRSVSTRNHPTLHRYIRCELGQKDLERPDNGSRRPGEGKAPRIPARGTAQVISRQTAVRPKLYY